VDRIRVGLAQVNVVVGDLEGNTARLLDAYADAVAAGCQVVVFPELCITGYPPEDLLLRPAFVAQAEASARAFATRTGGVPAIIGFPEVAAGELFNSAALCADGAVLDTYRKQLLPNYAVFDEERYFTPGDSPVTFDLDGVTFGITICEDAWYPDGPVARSVEAGAAVILNLNASPYFQRRSVEREAMLAQRSLETGAIMVYCNLVGGQDELVFDGASVVVDATGAVVARARQFVDDLLTVDLRADGGVVTVVEPARVEPLLDPEHEVWEALVLGTRDYVRKNGFDDVHIALSGGIDSAIVTAIAVDALGAEHVTCVLMPSRYSSEGSVTDAEALAANLGVKTHTIPIEPAHSAFTEMLADAFAGLPPGVAEENLQSRIRGNVMMTMSNKFNTLVLTTGNKSEMATGYATLYGDMAGGYAVIKDVPKTLVFRLCDNRNERAGQELIPRAIIDKPPSAELRPDQLDTDSLPPYDVLDPIIEGYVEDDRSIADLVADGHDETLVKRVAMMIDRNEYKRRQAAPGVRITPKAFGKDRRQPITNRWPG
jgi:NAD+ synthase (glutamine-hydrolysing)